MDVKLNFDSVDRYIEVLQERILKNPVDNSMLIQDVKASLADFKVWLCLSNFTGVLMLIYFVVFPKSLWSFTINFFLDSSMFRVLVPQYNQSKIVLFLNLFQYSERCCIYKSNSILKR